MPPLAIQLRPPAVSEIEKVAGRDPVLAAEGAVGALRSASWRA
jgi:hypothetical protein